MAKSIEERTQSMDELADELKAYLRKGRSTTDKMTVVGVAVDKPTQTGTQLDLKAEQPAPVDEPIAATDDWLRQRWQVARQRSSLGYSSHSQYLDRHRKTISPVATMTRTGLI